MNQSIEKDMTIEEILSAFPQKSQKLAQAMMNRGLHCVGCHASTWETLEEGMLGHGFSMEDLSDLLETLNAILKESVDPEKIQMTERAAKKFQEILKEEGKTGYGLRLSERAGGCSGFEYGLDFSKEAQEEDQVFHSHGVDIHINKVILPRMIGTEIDYVDGLQGAGFKISNPNVKSSCACSSSHNYLIVDGPFVYTKGRLFNGF